MSHSGPFDEINHLITFSVLSSWQLPAKSTFNIHARIYIPWRWP